MRPQDRDSVRALSLFRDMDSAIFDNLINAAYLQRFPAQVELIKEGDPADFLYIVVEGGVELFAGANGRESIMAMVRPVSTFILAATIRGTGVLDVCADRGEKPHRPHLQTGRAGLPRYPLTICWRDRLDTRTELTGGVLDD